MLVPTVQITRLGIIHHSHKNWNTIIHPVCFDYKSDRTIFLLPLLSRDILGLLAQLALYLWRTYFFCITSSGLPIQRLTIVAKFASSVFREPIPCNKKKIYTRSRHFDDNECLCHTRSIYLVCRRLPLHQNSYPTPLSMQWACWE